MIEPASIDTSINLGARTAPYKVRDKSGMGAFVSTVGSNIPTVDSGTGKVSVHIEMAATSSVKAAGGLSVSFTQSTAASNNPNDYWYSQTPYGQRFLALRKECLPRMRIVRDGC